MNKNAIIGRDYAHRRPEPRWKRILYGWALALILIGSSAVTIWAAYEVEDWLEIL